MIFICFVNLNFLIEIVNVFLLKVKANHGKPSAYDKALFTL